MENRLPAVTRFCSFSAFPVASTVVRPCPTVPGESIRLPERSIFNLLVLGILFPLCYIPIKYDSAGAVLLLYLKYCNVVFWTYQIIILRK